MFPGRATNDEGISAQLAAALSPPEDEPGRIAAGAAVALIGAALGFLMIGPLLVLLTNNMWMLAVGSAICALLGFILGFVLGARSKFNSHGYQRAIELWQSASYCGLHDVVFIPSETDMCMWSLDDFYWGLRTLYKP